MKIISKSLAETEKIASDFLNTLKLGETATVVGLSGNLGSGKTTFVQAIARLLGITEKVNSPTFVIMKSYGIESGIWNLESGKKKSESIIHNPNSRFLRLVHIDAYRLDSGSDLEKLKIVEIFADPKNLVLIEWPEIVESALPKNIHKIKFKHVSETERSISIES